jgi:hypothetical protein
MHDKLKFMVDTTYLGWESTNPMPGLLSTTIFQNEDICLAKLILKFRIFALV